MDPIPSNKTSSPLKQRLLAPIHNLFSKLNHQRHCPAISDQNWIEYGVERGLTEMESGCGFLQNLHYHPSYEAPKCSTYFEGLKSSRRLAHLRELNDTLTQSEGQNALRENPTAGLHPSLRDFHIYAGDGHFHAASTHDKRDAKGKKNPTGHLYAINLRTGLLNHLGLSGKGRNKSKPHDMGTLKRLEINALRQGAKKGKKVQKQRLESSARLPPQSKASRGQCRPVEIMWRVRECHRGLQGSGSVTRTFPFWLVRGRMPLPPD